MYNKVITIGNLTRDIEFKILPSGTALAKSAVATSYKYKSQNGEQKEEVCFLDFTMFGRSAEIANQYLKKGSKVMLEGRLVLERWVGQDGGNRSKHSLNVDNMKMLGDKSATSENTPYQATPSYTPTQQPSRNNEQQNTPWENNNKPIGKTKDVNLDEIPDDFDLF